MKRIAFIRSHQIASASFGYSITAEFV